MTDFLLSYKSRMRKIKQNIYIWVMNNIMKQTHIAFVWNCCVSITVNVASQNVHNAAVHVKQSRTCVYIFPLTNQYLQCWGRLNFEQLESHTSNYQTQIVIQNSYTNKSRKAVRSLRWLFFWSFTVVSLYKNPS